MDPRTRLDYALFQLTPTRTRCDLVIFTGGWNEKLASGLFQPFVSHLKSARDEISRGGYSFTLSPSFLAPWFTKSTLQRFVRFVSTPEVLERFLTLEQEIEQIEDSLQSNGAAIAGEAEGNESSWNSNQSMDLSLATDESNVDTVEENSKVRLQRVLGNRKAVLCKEQAMAYARALVVGFEPDCMEDLLAFAEAFGASRLKEACEKFRELCKRKNKDGTWVEQIAAMQALLPRPELGLMENSGIILAGEENGGSMDASSQDGKAQMQMQWLNPHHRNAPTYMFPPYMHWPPTMGDSEANERRARKSSKKKKKKKKKKSKQEDGSTEPSDSNSDSVSEEDKGVKRSSKRVVIRNINYVTSRRGGGKDIDCGESDEDDFIRQQVEEAVERSLEKRNKSNSRREMKHGEEEHRDNDSSGTQELKGNDHWDVFQNLVLKDKDSDNFGLLKPLPDLSPEESLRSSFPLEMESEVVRKQQQISDDSCLVQSFVEGEQVLQIRREDTDGEMMFPRRTAEVSENGGSKIVRNQQDWFSHNQSDPIINHDHDSILDETFVSSEFRVKKNEKEFLADDSFMIQSRVEDQTESLLTTDIMVSDIVGITQQKDDTSEIKHSKQVPMQEPDDLFMVLGREPVAEPIAVSWPSGIDYEDDIMAQEAIGINAKAETASDKITDDKDRKNTASRGKVTRMDIKSRASNRPDPTAKAKRPPWGSRAAAVPRSKPDREEESKKRREELLIQRQRRIAERNGGIGSGSLPSKKSLTATKTVQKDEKTTTSSLAQSKPKSVLRSSTVERLAAARTTPKETKGEKPPDKKLSSDKTAVAGKKYTTSVEHPGRTEIKENTDDFGMEFPTKKANPLLAPSVDDLKDIKEFHSVSSTETTKEMTESGDNICIVMSSDMKTVDDYSKVQNQMKGNQETEKPSVPICEDKQINRDSQSDDIAEGNPKKSMRVSEMNVEEKHNLSPRVSEIDMSTPPPSDSIQSDHSRKKWNSSEETSPKATAKVFRKLLMFGKNIPKT